ncbi:MAG: hypothetical protein MJ060_01250 [Clostridia bacterium]|nr:hypothetical protein [Clostridia bacterium]
MKNDLTELKQYYASLGMNDSQIQKVLANTMRDLDIIKIKIEDYQTLLHINQTQVVQMICLDPYVLNYDTISDSETSVKSKIKNYQTLLHVDEAKTNGIICKFPGLLHYDTISENETSVKSKIKNYQTLLHVNENVICKMIRLCPGILGFDTISDTETSVKGKLKSYQTLLHVDETKVIKMICSFPHMLKFDTISDAETSVKGKLKSYQTLLHADEANVIKMICSFPAMLNYDIVSENATSIKNLIKNYQKILQIDEDTVLQMIREFPGLLGFDTVTDETSGVKNKVQKLNAFVPKEHIINHPLILSVPAQQFKIRYMLASNINTMQDGILKRFLACGFMTSPGKVWARYSGLTSRRLGLKLSYIYQTEKIFQQRIGKKTEDLIKQYPLDLDAVHNIEQGYLRNTGVALKLDTKELAALGLVVDKQMGVANDGTKTF